MRTIDGRTDRRFRTDDVIVGGDGKIARSQHIDQFTAVEFKSHHGAIADLTLLGGGQDLRIAQFDGQLVDTATQARGTDYEDFQSSIVPYDVVLRYRMKDGGEVARYYRQATVGELSALLALDNDEHTHELENAASSAPSVSSSSRPSA